MKEKTTNKEQQKNKKNLLKAKICYNKNKSK